MLRATQAFALLAAFWIELQMNPGRHTFSMDRYRPQPVIVLLVYFFLRVAQAGLQIGGASGEAIFAIKVASAPVHSTPTAPLAAARAFSNEQTRNALLPCLLH